MSKRRRQSSSTDRSTARHFDDLSRREFLAGVAAVTGAIALGGCGDGSHSDDDPEAIPLPSPEESGIEHIVVVMMENRSFDHFLGWAPGADGIQAGARFTDKQGQSRPTFPLAPNFQNCQFEDPDHSYEGGRIQFNGGAVDGWLRANTDDLFPIGYYTQDDLSFYGGAVPAWTTFDRYFAAIMAATYPNRFFMHAAQTDRLDNPMFVSTLPTIWDRLYAAGLSGNYYYSDAPFSFLWGRHLGHFTRRFDDFLASAAAGTLPNVSYVDPRFDSESLGTSGDDHPLADIRNGQAFLNQIYEAVTSSPNWPNTVLVINYDEWGGFYDHVAPPMAPLTEQDRIIGNDGRLGFRVPCVIISPFARRGFVGHQQYDHTSILRMIEWRWGLQPLTVRDATANNIAQALDFTNPDLSAPRFSVPPGPFGVVCGGDNALARPEIANLRRLARQYGWNP